MAGVVGHAYPPKSPGCRPNPTHVTSPILRFLSLVIGSNPMPQRHPIYPARSNKTLTTCPIPLYQAELYNLQHTPRQRALTNKDALHLPTSNPHPTLQLPRLVEPTAPSPPHRRNRLLRQDRARLLAHQLRTAVHHRWRPQALHPLMRLETQQCRRERAGNRQFRRECGHLAAMGRGRWEGRGCARGGFYERAGGR